MKKCVGDLFALLARDLSDDQKTLFLRNVIGLDHMLFVGA